MRIQAEGEGMTKQVSGFMSAFYWPLLTVRGLGYAGSLFQTPLLGRVACGFQLVVTGLEFSMLGCIREVV